VLCEVLRRKLAPKGVTPIGFLRQRVLDPLQISRLEYRADRHGNPLIASGFRLTARQWSKLGLMLLGRGRSGDAVILQERTLETMLHGSRANPAFGFGLWLNQGAGRRGARETDIEQMLERPWQKQEWKNACLCRDAPADLVAAVGSGYQRLWVIPSLGLVVVRQGDDARFSDADFLRILLRR
jgi:CubicO group peptidase (beta-lactamase class C family)